MNSNKKRSKNKTILCVFYIVELVIIDMLSYDILKKYYTLVMVIGRVINKSRVYWLWHMGNLLLRSKTGWGYRTVGDKIKEEIVKLTRSMEYSYLCISQTEKH